MIDLLFLYTYILKHLGERFYMFNISSNCDKNVTKKKIKFQNSS